MFDLSPGNVKRIAELARERTLLVERLAEIDEVLKRDLPTRLTAVAATSNKPLRLIDFVVQMMRAGYTTKAKGGPSGMIYHGLRFLVRHGVLKRDITTHGYVFSGSDPTLKDDGGLP
jgi:hypothetical protein